MLFPISKWENFRLFDKIHRFFYSSLEPYPLLPASQAEAGTPCGRVLHHLLPVAVVAFAVDEDEDVMEFRAYAGADVAVLSEGRP